MDKVYLFISNVRTASNEALKYFLRIEKLCPNSVLIIDLKEEKTDEEPENYCCWFR